MSLLTGAGQQCHISQRHGGRVTPHRSRAAVSPLTVAGRPCHPRFSCMMHDVPHSVPSDETAAFYYYYFPCQPDRIAASANLLPSQPFRRDVINILEPGNNNMGGCCEEDRQNMLPGSSLVKQFILFKYFIFGYMMDEACSCCGYYVQFTGSHAN